MGTHLERAVQAAKMLDRVDIRNSEGQALIVQTGLGGILCALIDIAESVDREVVPECLPGQGSEMDGLTREEAEQMRANILHLRQMALNLAENRGHAQREMFLQFAERLAWILGGTYDRYYGW